MAAGCRFAQDAVNKGHGHDGTGHRDRNASRQPGRVADVRDPPGGRRDRRPDDDAGRHVAPLHRYPAGRRRQRAERASAAADRRRRRRSATSRARSTRFRASAAARRRRSPATRRSGRPRRVPRARSPRSPAASSTPRSRRTLRAARQRPRAPQPAGAAVAGRRAGLALAKTVGESGLFYESHLVEWLAGQRPAASLADEPQARVDSQRDAARRSISRAARRGHSRMLGLTNAACAACAPTATSHDPPDLHRRPRARSRRRRTRSRRRRSRNRCATRLPSALSSAASATRGCQRRAPRRKSPRCRRRCWRASIHRRFRSCASNSMCSPPASFAGPARRGPARGSNGRSRRRSATRARPTPTTTPSAPWRTRVTLSLPTLGTVDADLVLTRRKARRADQRERRTARRAWPPMARAFGSNSRRRASGSRGCRYGRSDGSTDFDADSLTGANCVRRSRCRRRWHICFARGRGGS